MPTNDDLVSVIVPAYNHERYIQQALQSLIDQSYHNLELIVIDDGSTDNTWGKIEEMKEACKQRFKRLIFKKQKNSGTMAVLSQTLDMASGKYVYYLASDDIAHPQAIKKLHANIGDAALIFPDLAFIDENGKRIYLTDSDLSKITYDEQNCTYRTYHEAFTDKRFPDMDDSNFDWYKNLLYACCCNIGFLAKKEALVKIGAFKNKNVLLEDYSMYLQLSKFYKIKRLKEVLFYYRRHSNNISKNSEYMDEGNYRIFMQEKNYCYQNGYRVEWDKIFWRYFRHKLPVFSRLVFRLSAYIYRKLGFSLGGGE